MQIIYQINRFLVIALLLSFKAYANLPNCASLPDGQSAQIGVNCLYYGLPQCKDVATPKHRQNCADLIDLPLCSQINLGTAKAGKNCVELCSHPSYSNPNPSANPALVRGVDYAIFNEQCTRFCDSVEEGIVADPGKNCVKRLCHQLDAQTTPDPGSNCDILQCNLLAPDELNQPKFDDATKKYCAGENLKCYNFSIAQLPYLRVRKDNPMCLIHDCKPILESCGADDTQNITNKGEEYVTDYQKYIYGGYDIASPSICTPIDCRPILKDQYRCVDGSGKITGKAEEDLNRNSNCDAQGDGAKCVANYCFKTIDCNTEYNKKNHPKCAVGSANSTSISYSGDPFDSWFYRPKPLDKAVDGNGILLKMHDDINDNRLCYDTNIIKDYHNWGEKLNFLFDTYWFHSGWFDDTRSPGSCNNGKTGNHGDRGWGFLYLCGTKGLLYSKPSDYASYYKGHIRTTFEGTGAKHKITVCSRFKNTVNLDACGARECGIDAAFDDIDHVTCGFDHCQEFEIDDADPRKCMMSDHYAVHGNENGCSKVIDKYVRNRVVKYDDRICAFLDAKGHLAYDKQFMPGSATLDDGVTCVSDPDGNKPCQGFDSNTNEGLADRWRAIMKINYVQNNRPKSDSVRGYLDKSGKLFKEQECPKITLRVAPPDLYNLANPVNSPRLFTPPLYIRSVSVIRGGSDAKTPPGQDFGITDFHYPEIRVQFGANTTRMSLALNEDDGQRQDYISLDNSSPAYTTLETTSYGRTYKAELFVKKEYSPFQKRPIFCLYRKLKDANGLYIQPFRVGCVNRKLPEINNEQLRLALPSTPIRQIFTYLDPQSTSQDPIIALRYVAGFGANNKFDKCQIDDICSEATTLNNADISTNTCLQGIESYKLCARRQECSKLFNECVQNEVDYNIALNNNRPTTQYEALRKYCNDDLIPHCNAKRGIYNAPSSNIYQEITDPSKTANPQYYGWFNEICISSGFESKLKDIVAYSVSDGNLGKCLISPLSPYLTDSDPNTNCENGGFAPNCLCIEAPTGYMTSAGESIRKQTPREAGLCVDIPLPKLCPAIDYNLNPNPNDPSDPEYIKDSIGASSYGTTGVHITHKYRTQGKPEPDPVPNAGHAEFSTSFAGVQDVRGACQGFWTYAKNANDVTLYPKMSCIDNQGQPEWQIDTVKDPCVRFSCPAINTFGPDANGHYQGDYAPGENGEDKGKSHGFALWPKFTKTNDFLESASASACIPGFKAQNSTPVQNNQGKIIGYQGGTLPTRSCTQVGDWFTPNNSCQRIKCAAINPVEPKDANDKYAWGKWFETGGAVFDETLASRSSIRTQNESIAYGSCNNDLGFFQSPNGNPPSRECDYLGNWLAVKDACVSSCDAVTDNLAAETPNNGFAKWKEATGSMSVNGIEGEFTSCSPGYVPYPYAPRFDLEHRELANANDLTRAPENPRRLCKTGKTSKGTEVSVWTAAINSCIKECPGATYDDRIGVGRTKHASSTGEITLSWPSAKFGEYAYITNFAGQETDLNAGYFHKDRTNRYYLMRRFCGANGKWQDPEPLCSANGGQLGHATYLKDQANPGFANSIAVAKTKITGACIDDYWSNNRGSDPLPKRQCQFLDDKQEIDKTYLSLIENTKDCEHKQCGPREATTTDRVKIPEITNWHKTGDQIQGTCQDFHTQFGTTPTIHCQDNGEWSQIQDETNCKKSCNFPQVGGYGVRYDCNGWGYMGVRAITMQHGGFANFTICGCCGGECNGGINAYYCNDGQAIAKRISAAGRGYCSIRRFDLNTMDWGDYRSGIHLNWDDNRNSMWYQDDGSLYRGRLHPDYIDGYGVSRRMPIYVIYWD